MKLLLEVVPLVVFFVGYKFLGIIGATVSIVCAMSISAGLHYFLFRKVPVFMLVSLLLILVMGVATVVSGNANFIKMKPTILFAVVSASLFYGVCRKKYYVKSMFGHVFTMSDDAWSILSKRMIVFFLFMACVNEFVWRLFSEAAWVSFKVFGFFPIVLLFMLCQLPLFNKYSKEKL